jgi:amino acid transporter
MIPLSMVVGILTLASTYLLFALALKSALPQAVLQESRVPHLVLGQRLFSLHGLLLMQCISAMALVTILNAGVIGASRFLYVLGRDRCFFAWLNQRLILLNRRGVSEASVILLCGLALLSALMEIHLDDVQRVAELCAGLYCIVYSVFVASHIRLRAQAKARSPFHAALPVGLYYLLGAALMALGVATFIGSAEQFRARALLLVLICITAGYAAIAVSRSRRPAVASPG